MIPSIRIETVVAFTVALGVGSFAAMGASVQLANATSYPAAPACWNRDFHVQGWDNDSYNWHTSGVKTKIWIPNGYAKCARISSVAIFGPAEGQFIEWGFVHGKPLWGGNEAKPKLFAGFKTWAQANPVYWTGGGNIINTGVRRGIGVQDKDQNTVWRAYFRGNFKYRVDLDFTYGTALTNAERKTSRDRGRADFRKLSEFHVGNGWTKFDNVRRQYDNDPDYRFVRKAANAHDVRLG